MSKPLPYQKGNEPLLKIYPAKFWGDRAMIIGDREALNRLRATLEAVLEDKDSDPGFTETFQDNGEEYLVIVKLINTEMEEDKLPLSLEIDDISYDEAQQIEDFMNRYDL